MYKKLLVPLDRSPLSENALGHALDIARAVNGSIDLVLVHQPDNVDGFAHDDWNPHIWELEAHYLEEVAAEIRRGLPSPSRSHTCAATSPTRSSTTRARRSSTSS